jgi:hypothetical protein
MTYGWHVTVVAASELIDRARIIAGMFALQQALPAARFGDVDKPRRRPQPILPIRRTRSGHACRGFSMVVSGRQVPTALIPPL